MSVLTGRVSPCSQMSQKPHGLSLPRVVVPDEYVPPGAQLRVDELVQGDSAVRDVRFGEAGPILEPLEIVTGLGYQGNGDTVSNLLTGNASPGGLARTGSHRVILLLRDQRRQVVLPGLLAANG